MEKNLARLILFLTIAIVSVIIIVAIVETSALINWMQSYLSSIGG